MADCRPYMGLRIAAERTTVALQYYFGVETVYYSRILNKGSHSSALLGGVNSYL